jgi:hypothetical protein
MSGNRRPLGGAFGFLNSVFDDPFFSQGFGGALEAHFGGGERVRAAEGRGEGFGLLMRIVSLAAAPKWRSLHCDG